MVFIKNQISDLRNASMEDLSKKFSRCHDEIWEGGKKDPAIAFDEFTKILMIKIYDELFTKSGQEYKFQIIKNETKSQIAKKIKEITKNVEIKFPIFKNKIKLSSNTVYEIIKQIQDISFVRTDLDVKGRAFENFLGKMFRDEYGQYFTPRPIVDFAVNFLDPKMGETIIDPACGSGGFLVYSLKHISDKFPKEDGNNL